ncbi:hypothetical protein BZA77DRAFT_363281 [Pyronema omphalodes]|nr:hypothetical protein BZA77DRAFT_363281 [Pyronema omphalodes]
MKSAKTITSRQVPEWSTSYINYKGLKKEIKEAEKQKKSWRVTRPCAFLFALDRNIETSTPSSTSVYLTRIDD